MINKERKLDTRNKIELGGLVVKAKLAYLQENHKDVILGALVDAYNKIHDPNAGEQNFQFYKAVGEELFKKSKTEIK
jgi:hypothetical protein